ncbi:hypothetical protein [Pseudobacteroides cellulosolvens]|uniref:Uncharacterized protein n=1 Tax=Pseudobacteroides cellulosolvens ATCC 35603 = DSM 2933 TaxID=398512 RepID=A0A0L6JGH4_9FIRM|nr:hypothetical protein [Pseudobacteroides cellulosolvens]KNY24971.1 hypothetical protein Bccel_0228 [Pseudobacteroides cellulosolvens ATCC 35603 = DSM 2933]
MISKIIAGDYLNQTLMIHQPMFKKEILYIVKGFTKKNWIEINKDTVEAYEVLNKEHQKSATSAIGRAFIGSALLGGIGLFAGLSAKNKGIYIIAIQFKDGKKSLLETDEKMYKKIMQILF